MVSFVLAKTTPFIKRDEHKVAFKGLLWKGNKYANSESLLEDCCEGQKMIDQRTYALNLLGG